MIIGSRLCDRPATTEPATSMAILNSSIRRLPYMSPSRPTVGVATAAASKVAVIAQLASAADAFSSFGSWGTRGMISVERMIPCSGKSSLSSSASAIPSTNSIAVAATV